MSNLPEFRIDAATGDIRIGKARLFADQEREAALALFSGLEIAEQDMRTGYTWSNIRWLSFGGMPAVLALCFFERRLCGAHWGVRLRDGPADEEWPTREQSDAEVAFVREVLSRDFGTLDGKNWISLPWGTIGSAFDEKMGGAANFIHYPGWENAGTS